MLVQLQKIQGVVWVLSVGMQNSGVVGTWMWMRVSGVGREMVGVGMGVAVTSVVLHTNKLKRPGNGIVI